MQCFEPWPPAPPVAFSSFTGPFALAYQVAVLTPEPSEQPNPLSHLVFSANLQYP